MRCTPYRRAASSAPFAQLNRWFLTLLALVSLTAPALTPANAQAGAASGTVRGKVQNATNGAFMENVAVSIIGTNRETLTNSYGEYQFTNVPAGEVSLRAKYVGEAEQTASVTDWSR